MSYKFRPWILDNRLYGRQLGIVCLNFLKKSYSHVSMTESCADVALVHFSYLLSMMIVSFLYK